MITTRPSQNFAKFKLEKSHSGSELIILAIPSDLDVAISYHQQIKLYDSDPDKKNESSIALFVQKAGTESINFEVGELTSKTLPGKCLQADYHQPNDLSLDEIVGCCRSAKIQHNIGLIIFDDYQVLLKSILNSERLEKSKIGIDIDSIEVSRALEKMTKELNVTVIIIYKLQDDIPKDIPAMNYLRSSGLEVSADTIILVGNESVECQPINISIIKNRNGRK